MFRLAGRSARRRKVVAQLTAPTSRLSTGTGLSLVNAGTELGKVLALRRPVRWLIVGDSLLRPDARNQVRSLSQGVADAIHGELGRPSDLVIDCTRFGQKIKPSFVARAVALLSEECPDVVLLICGNRDAIGGVGGLHRLEDSLDRLLAATKNSGCPTVLNTPPCLRPRAWELDAIQQVYREELLAAASRHGALLVDHWGYWHRRAVESGSLNAWLGSERSRRAHRGLDEFVCLMQRKLRAARCRSAGNTLPRFRDNRHQNDDAEAEFGLPVGGIVHGTRPPVG